MDHLLRNNGGALPLLPNMVGFQAPKTRDLSSNVEQYFFYIDTKSASAAPRFGSKKEGV
jgi:hypothetical protein